MNVQGKLTNAAVTALFTPGLAPDENNLWQAEVLAVRHSGEGDMQVALDLHIPTALTYFSGHFPGRPILPGVVQIDWVIRHARDYLPLAGSFTALEYIKFQSLVLPDSQLELVLKLSSDKTQLAFIFATSQRKCSSGRIIFGGVI
jgi:3-hydroxymyristoyl/3-hydroxydecanoyl-(acyl carrier protein) dehydratase